MTLCHQYSRNAGGSFEKHVLSIFMLQQIFLIIHHVSKYDLHFFYLNISEYIRPALLKHIPFPVTITIQHY